MNELNALNLSTLSSIPRNVVSWYCAGVGWLCCCRYCCCFLQIHHLKYSTINWLQCASLMRFNEHKRTILKMASKTHIAHITIFIIQMSFRRVGSRVFGLLWNTFLLNVSVLPPLCTSPSALSPCLIRVMWCIDMQLFLLLLLLMLLSLLLLFFSDDHTMLN